MAQKLGDKLDKIGQKSLQMRRFHNRFISLLIAAGFSKDVADRRIMKHFGLNKHIIFQCNTSNLVTTKRNKLGIALDIFHHEIH